LPIRSALDYHNGMFRLCAMSAARFNEQHHDDSAEEVIHAAVSRFRSKPVLTTSFGIQSAVLLHMTSRIRPDIPVVWIDTGYLPPETYRYAEDLTKQFDLNLQVYQSDLSPARMEAIHGRLWERSEPEALDAYHRMRKVQPLHRAFRDLGAKIWITGVRSTQTDFRSGLDRAVRHGVMCKIHPLLHWTDDDVERYFRRWNLPRHPLESAGYRTVGDAHLSRATGNEDEPDRATRFGGKRQECGIHLPVETPPSAPLIPVTRRSHG